MAKKKDPLTLDLFVGEVFPDKDIAEEETVQEIELNFLDPARIELRAYQLPPVIRILKEKANYGLVMPTGMGKTFVAFLVMDSVLKDPESRVLFLAPTRPLCYQHYQDILDVFQIPEEEVILLSGRIKWQRRKRLWPKGRIIISTPQIVANDLKIHPQLGKPILERKVFKKFKLVIFDEMHHAVEKYAYVAVAQVCQELGSQILGLTASPGGKVEKIEKIKSNLYLKDWLSVTLRSDSMKKFRLPREETHQRILLDPELAIMSEIMEGLLRETYEKLAQFELVPSSFKILSQSDLKKIRSQIQKNIENPPEGTDEYLWKRMILNFTLFYLLFRLHQYLVTENLESFLSFLNTLEEEALEEKGRRTVRIIVNHPQIQELKEKVENLLSSDWLHPKLRALLEIAQDIKTKGKTAIIFCRYIESCLTLKKHLENLGIRCDVLFGQKEMSQKIQQEKIASFKKGDFQILISTTIGQEGLHIPRVDEVIHYSVPWNEIEIIQRNGRCGRGKRGKVWVLIMDHELDLSYFYSALAKKKRMRQKTEEKRRFIMEKEIKKPGWKETIFESKKKKEEEFVQNLREGLIHARLMVFQIEMKASKESKRPFIRMKLGDKTGVLNGFHWCPEGASQAQSLLKKIKPGDVVIVLGELEENEKWGKSIIIDPKKDQYVVKCEEDYELSDYLRVSPRNPKELLEKVEKIIQQFKNPYLKKLLLAFFNNPEIKEKLISTPAAVIHHHNYWGGLIEHIWELIQLAEAQIKIDPDLDRELLLSGVILHDIGKIKTYQATPSTVEVSEKEELIGHLTLSVFMVRDVILQIPDFPEELSDKILHLILSHHGELSEVKPSLPEAKVLHQIDLLNSQLKSL